MGYFVVQSFDNLAHQPLLAALRGFPARTLIRQWLQAGCLEQQTFHPTETGTPQGGVISPLLLNIALHGMEELLGIRYKANGDSLSQRALVRYADDFVIFCESKAEAHQVIQLLTAWLAQRGLALSPEKTAIRHIRDGFDFLGFTIRQYPAPTTTKNGWKLLIKPSKASVTKLKGKLRQVWQSRQGTNVQTLVPALNPMIRGWANYFRSGVAKKTFRQLDNWMFQRQRRYAKRTHPNKSWTWQQTRYWGN